MKSSIGRRPQDNGLDETAGTKGMGQLLERLFVNATAGLVWSGIDQVKSDFLRPANSQCGLNGDGSTSWQERVEAPTQRFSFVSELCHVSTLHYCSLLAGGSLSMRSVVASALEARSMSSLAKRI